MVSLSDLTKPLLFNLHCLPLSLLPLSSPPLPLPLLPSSSPSLVCRQWLPEEKIERLGASAEQDSIKIAMSGHSKRSVLQAFQRAKQYQRKVESKAYPRIVENDSETDDSES